MANVTAGTRMLPYMVSVDDHVMEPPSVWTDRLPSKYKEIGPRVIREQADSGMPGGGEKEVDVWYFEDVRVPLTFANAAAGQAADVVDWAPITFDEIRPGCFEVPARLADMDVDGVEAAVCFPNMFVRFCGQRFLEGKDRELARLCVIAYNDWLIEEWSKPSDGRLIPSPIVPLWDAELAAAEVRRNAERGAHAVCFSEIPARLGLPSMYCGYWDPFLATCEETETVVNVHIGSSSVINSTSPDAPFVTHTSNHYGNSSLSLSDWLMSGTFLRYPSLRVAFSEGQAGWIPFLMSRLDGIWQKKHPFMGVDVLPEPPSTYLAEHIYVCVFDDPTILRHLDGTLPVDNICFETDYPHPDGSWPNSREAAEAQTRALSAEDTEKILRLNGARLYQIDRVLSKETVNSASARSDTWRERNG